MGKIAARRHDLARNGSATRADIDPGADRVAIALVADEFEAEPVISEMLIIAQQQWRSASLRQDDIEVPVAIDIGEG